MRREINQRASMVGNAAHPSQSERMRVTRLFTRIDRTLVQEALLPRKGGLSLPDAVGLLTNLPPASEDAAPPWSIQIALGDGPDAQTLTLFCIGSDHTCSYSSSRVTRTVSASISPSSVD
jgi:hypothetical protein